MNKQDNTRHEGRDPHLDIPSEANRDKHINFRENEDDKQQERRSNKEVEERRRQWKEGLEEGEKARREGS